MEMTVNRAALSQVLQEQLKDFEGRVADYKALQAQFREIEQETQRLHQAADALEAEAAAANQAWKALAQERAADQKKINSKIEQGAKLKDDAERQRTIAQAREELRRDLLVQMAGARLNLVSSVEPLNSAYRQERIEALMKTDGMAKVLTELYALLRDQLAAERVKAGRAAKSIYAEGQREEAQTAIYKFGKLLVKQIGTAGEKAMAPGLASIPPVVSGEVVASGAAAFKKFRESGGEVSGDSLRSGSLRVV